MSNGWRILISFSEMLGGLVIALFTIVSLFKYVDQYAQINESSHHYLTLGSQILFLFLAGLTFIAGRKLWADEKKGYKLSLIVQALQITSINIFGFSFSYSVQLMSLSIGRINVVALFFSFLLFNSLYTIQEKDAELESIP